MKLISLILLVILVYSCSGNKTGISGKNSDVHKNEKTIRGKIKMITYYSYGPYGECSVYIDQYDTSGLLQASMTEREGKQHVNVMYKYNQLKEKIEEIHFVNDGRKSEDYTFTYNEKKQITLREDHLADTAWNVRYRYKYDAKGNKIEEIITQHHVVIKRSYEYDTKGNRIAENFYDDKSLVEEKDTFKYNDSGDIIDAMEKTQAGGSKFYKSNWCDSAVRLEQLDAAGNWLKKTEYSTCYPKRITKRVIVYY